MTLDNRLSRLVSNLSARDRAIMFLKAHAAGTEPDPEVWRSMPETQAPQFKRYMALAFVANYQLGTVFTAIAHHAQRLQAFLDVVETLRTGANDLEKQYGEYFEEPKRGWRRGKDISVPTFLRGLAMEQKVLLLRDVRLLWQELRALETLWQEIAAEFDGQETRSPEIVARAEEVGATLRELNMLLAGKRARLPEPDEAMFAVVRRHAEQPYALLGLAERRS